MSSRSSASRKHRGDEIYQIARFSPFHLNLNYSRFCYFSLFSFFFWCWSFGVSSQFLLSQLILCERSPFIPPKTLPESIDKNIIRKKNKVERARNCSMLTDVMCLAHEWRMDSVAMEYSLHCRLEFRMTIR